MTSFFKTRTRVFRLAQHDRMSGARTALFLLLAINLFNYIDRQILAALEPEIRATFFAAHDVQAMTKTGLLGDAFFVTYMISAPILGLLADRFSRWIIVGSAVILWSLASGASGLAQTFVMLLLTRCFVGIGEAAYGPVAPAMISDMFPLKIRGKVMAWFYVAIPVGSALGYVLGGSVASSNIGNWGAAWIGLRQESWRWAFFLVTLPGVVLGLRSLMMREPPRGDPDFGQAIKPEPVKWKDYLILVRTPSYALAFNNPSVEKYEPLVASNGALIYNVSLTSHEITRRDIHAVPVPADPDST